MTRLFVASLVLAAAATAQPKPAQPAADLAESMARRLAEQMNVKTIVGKPVVAGSVTLIPILTVDVSFGGLDIPAPKPDAPGGGAFLITGEARPLGFVAITKHGTRFLAVPKPGEGKKTQ